MTNCKQFGLISDAPCCLLLSEPGWRQKRLCNVEMNKTAERMRHLLSPARSCERPECSTQVNVWPYSQHGVLTINPVLETSKFLAVSATGGATRTTERRRNLRRGSWLRGARSVAACVTSAETRWTGFDESGVEIVGPERTAQRQHCSFFSSGIVRHQHTDVFSTPHGLKLHRATSCRTPVSHYLSLVISPSGSQELGACLSRFHHN